MIITVLAIIEILLSWSPSLASPISSLLFQTPEVTLKNGTLVGQFIDSFSQDAYLGIPYAEPPIGDLRFVNPQTYNHSWGNSVKQFTNYSAACYATGGTDSKGLEQSEDCLTLNIVKPHGYEDQNLPVAIWIHGGGFYDGSSASPLYNLSYIVRNGKNINKPFIGVSINYRLSGFGWLSSQEVQGRGYTNVGLRDQLKAIEWIHENIQAFGGDPQHLVIWGESAGGTSVSILLALGKLGDYVKAAIIESSTGFLQNQTNDDGQAYGQTDYDALINHFNCLESKDSFQCLQNVEVTNLVDMFNLTNAHLQEAFQSPYIDGNIAPMHPIKAFAEGNFKKIPTLIGANTDEGVMFVNKSDIQTTDDFKQFISDHYPYLDNNSVEEINQLYPLGNNLTQVPLDPTYNYTANTIPSKYGPHWARLACFYGNIFFLAFSRFAAKYISSNGVPVYRYRHNIPNLRAANHSFLGTQHFDEVVYVFDNAENPLAEAIEHGLYPSFQAPKIAKTMSKMWASFIVDLNPNFEDVVYRVDNAPAPDWPTYSSHDNATSGAGGNESGQNMVFDLQGLYLENDTFRIEQFDFLKLVVPELSSIPA